MRVETFNLIKERKNWGYVMIYCLSIYGLVIFFYPLDVLPFFF